MASSSDFINNYIKAQTQRDVEQSEKEEKEASDKASVDKFNTAVSDYIKGYSAWAKDNKGKYADSSEKDLDARVRNLVKMAGKSDGKLNDDSTEAEIAEYGTTFLNNLSGKKDDGSDYAFKDYLSEYGHEEAKEATKRQLRGAAAQEYINKLREANNYNPYASGVKEAEEAIRLAKQREEGDLKWINSSKNWYNEWKSKNSNDLYGIFENYDDEELNPTTEKKDEPNVGKNGGDKKAEGKKESTDDSTTGEEVTFTLTKGNDPNYRGFGQKLVDLGLATSKGLWGEDGDVAFYNKQLHDQGIYGNLPIGVPIKLKKRKV
jgi:hypothetical protein